MTKNNLSRREMLLLTLGLPLSAGVEHLIAGDGLIRKIFQKHPPKINQKEKSLETGFLYDDIYLQHKTPDGFPESPQRLSAIVKQLNQEKLMPKLAKLNYSPDGLKWLPGIHSQQYIDRVKRKCRDHAAFMDSNDVPISPRSYEVAVAAVGAPLAAIDAVMENKIKNAFCAIRPPGHHALKNRAMGFCIFNNIAVAARYFQKKYQIKDDKVPKVLIIDWDVHHGNGTQNAFYGDPTVFYFSIHQYPFYPGTGSKDEHGTGPGLGHTLNVPCPAGTEDHEYIKIFQEILTPAALTFNPDFVLISSGFDAHRNDSIGGMKVTTDGFARLTRIVKNLAKQCCQDRLVSILEGGYNLDYLAESVAVHVEMLMDKKI